MQEPKFVPGCESGCASGVGKPGRPAQNVLLDSGFYQQLDALYKAGEADRAERFLLDTLKVAEEQQSAADCATVYNELMGHYRTKGDFEHCAFAMRGLLRQIRALNLKDGIEYATFMLNIANAERAMGKLDEAEVDFLKVRDVYERILDEEDMRMASLCNNMGLLYRQKGKVDSARNYFIRALGIASSLPGGAYAVAATSSNLADMLAGEGDLTAAVHYARMAVSAYDDPDMPQGVDLSAALAASARIELALGNLDAAIEQYERAAATLEHGFGRTRAYRTICRNLAQVYRLAGREDDARRADELAQE